MTAIALSPTLDAWVAAVGVVARDVYAITMVDVASERWHEAIESARDDAHLVRLEFIAAVDEADGSFTIVAHFLNGEPDLLSLFVRTTLSNTDVLESIADVFPGAAWHEREMAEMFGVVFSGDVRERLLLSPTMPTHPMLKSFWLEPRQDRPWPGAKEPGESDADVGVETDQPRPRRSRRRQTTFGVQPPATDRDRA